MDNDEMTRRSWNDLNSVQSMETAKNPTPENLRKMSDIDNIARSYNYNDSQD